MNQFTVEVPTMADVLATIRGNAAFAQQKREAMISALYSLETWTGQALRDIKADVPRLAELFGTVQPAALGITPKTLSNVKSLCLSALKQSELVPGLLRKVAKGRPKDPAWVAIWAALTTQAQRNSISRLVNWCDRNHVVPEAVNDEVIDHVMAEMAATSLRPNQYQVRRSMAKVWDELVDVFPGKGLQKVTIPPSRLRRLLVPLDSFPASLLEDWNDYARWAHGEDVFADDARPKRLKQSTLDTMLRRIHSAANALVDTGVESRPSGRSPIL